MFYEHVFHERMFYKHGEVEQNIHLQILLLSISF